MDKIKKPQQATALKYDPTKDSIPIITAIGTGKVAEKIVEIAEGHDISVIENEQLSDILVHLSVGDAIPPKLYEAVARILIFISQKDQDFYKKLQFHI